MLYEILNVNPEILREVTNLRSSLSLVGNRKCNKLVNMVFVDSSKIFKKRKGDFDLGHYLEDLKAYQRKYGPRSSLELDVDRLYTKAKKRHYRRH